MNFPDLPVARVFNFSPKDWRTKPTYNFKDQTESVNAKKLPYLLALATIEDEKRDNTLTIVRGVLDLDNGKIADNILSLSLSELIKKKASEKDTPEQAASGPETPAETGTSGKAPKKAAKRAKATGTINPTPEPEKAGKTEIDEKLPWEKPEPGKVVVGFDPAEPAAPIPTAPAPDPEPEKENLLFTDIEI